MKTAGSSIWEKFDIEEYKVSLQASAMPAAPLVENPEPGADRLGLLRKRWFWIALNVTATVIWLYAALKLLVTDLDRWVVSAVAPSWLWVLDYRFFIVLLVATLLLLFAKQWKTVLILSYVWLFPLIVLVWWLPRLYYRRRSWDFVLGTLQIVWSLAQSIRFALLAFTVFAFGTLAIALGGPHSLLKVDVMALLALWFWLLFRAIGYAIAPSKFVVYQQRIIGKVLDSSVVWTLTALPPAAKSPEVARLSKGEIDRAIGNASLGLALYALSALWATKLDRYRKSGISLLFSAFGVVALLLEGLVIFTVANFGIYRLDPSEYAFATAPRLVTFIRYSFSSMYGGEIDALQPTGTWASIVSVLTGVSCAVIVTVLIVSVVFSLKQGRDDMVSDESITAMRAKAEAFADKLTGEYRLPLLDLLDRIAELNGVFSGWTRQIVYAHRRAGEKVERI